MEDRIIDDFRDKVEILERENNIDIFIDFADKEMFIHNQKKSKTFKLPKKLDYDWIAKKVDIFLDGSYKNLSGIFSSLVNGFTYSTSYGIGYSCLFSDKEKFDSDTKLIENKLNNLGIEFKAQFSDARYILRYIISTKKENLDVIKGL